MPRAPHSRLFGWQTVVVCVVVGVVANVGVAWGLALWVQLGDSRYEADTLFYRTTPSGWTYVLENDPSDVRSALRVDELSWPPDGFDHPADQPDAKVRLDWAWYHGFTYRSFASGPLWDSPYVVQALASGLPMRGAGWFAEVPSMPDRRESWAIDTGIAVRSDSVLANCGWTTARLPLRPLFPSFIVNTLFYAGLVFAPVVGARVVRRRRRAKRGRCIACGYDLADLIACPECGVERAT